MAAIRWQSALEVLVKSILAFYALRFIRKRIMSPQHLIPDIFNRVLATAECSDG